MNKKISKFFKKQLDGVKDLSIDLVPRFASLLDPQVFQNTETIKAGLVNIATNFVASRVGEMLKEISADKNVSSSVLESQKSTQTVLELVKFVTQENPDPEVWNAAKKIFIRTLRNKTTDQERILLYSYLNLCQKLSGAEIMILAGSYKIYKHVKQNEYPYDLRSHHHRRLWAREVAEIIGYKTEEEVLLYEDNLAKQKLIYPTQFLNGNEQGDWVAPGYAHRLTALGINFSDSLSLN